MAEKIIKMPEFYWIRWVPRLLILPVKSKSHGKLLILHMKCDIIKIVLKSLQTITGNRLLQWKHISTKHFSQPRPVYLLQYLCTYSCALIWEEMRDYQNKTSCPGNLKVLYCEKNEDWGEYFSLQIVSYMFSLHKKPAYGRKVWVRIVLTANKIWRKHGYN